MTFLSSTQLAKMRSQVTNGMLPDTCVIMLAGTAQVVIDDGGGFVEVPTPATAGTVACRVDPLGQSTNSALEEASLQEILPVQYQLTTPYDAPLAANCKVVHNGHTYQVVKMDIDHSWNVSRRAIMVEVR
jgi:hypothetical protein